MEILLIGISEIDAILSYLRFFVINLMQYIMIETNIDFKYAGI